MSLLTAHGFLDGHAASSLGVEGQSSNSNKSWDFFVAGKGGSNGTATGMELGLDTSHAVTFNIRSTANAGKTFGTCMNEWFKGGG